MVVKRALPCSSRLTPVGAPIGFSGDFSSDGARVFSAHCCSDAEGWRPCSKRSLTGVSRVLPVGLVLSGMNYPTISATKADAAVYLMPSGQAREQDELRTVFASARSGPTLRNLVYARWMRSSTSR